MPSFPKPRKSFDYDLKKEIHALRAYRDTCPGRQIPSRRDDNLLVATWNIANLGLHKRKSNDYALMAEIVSWFDLVAIQEVNDDLSGLRGIQAHLPGSWRALFSDKSGNEERLVFLYDGGKVSLKEMVGEIAVPVRDHKHIKLPGVRAKFQGFDRNPYLASFRAGAFEFLLVNVHLFFGKDDRPDRERRSLEAFATSRWGDLRRHDKDAYLRHIIVVGDFNLPKVEPSDLVYQALRSRGLKLPLHSCRIGSSIATDRAYDQIVFYANTNGSCWTGKAGIFDFDGAVCKRLWRSAGKGKFLAWLRYYVSDHRPLWSEFTI